MVAVKSVESVWKIVRTKGRIEVMGKALTDDDDHELDTVHLLSAVHISEITEQ